MTRDEFKEQVRSAVAVDYPGYFSQRIERLTQAGDGQFLGVCPFHGDTKKSFSLNAESGLWNCKGCNESGDIFTFHAKFYNLGGFKAALLDLAQKYGIDPPEGFGPEGKYSQEKNDKGRKSECGGGNTQGNSKGRQSNTQRKKTLPSEKDIDAFHQRLMNDSAALEQIQKQRLLSLETIKKFQLGLHTGREKDAEKGWINRTRLTIPIRDESGKLINVRRYSTSAEFKMISWGQGYGGAFLFGLNDLATWPANDEVIICEGEFDRLLLIQAGFKAVTHTNGAMSFQPFMADYFKGRRVVLLYDADGFPPNPEGKTKEERQGEGGRAGSLRTSKLLAPVVESLKAIDLKAAGLVAGTEVDNDISDMARRRAEWPQELRRVIEASTALDLSALALANPGGLDDEFVKVVERDGRWWVWKKDGEVPISNFILEPTRRIRIERQEVLEALVCQNGSGKRSEITLWPHHFAQKASFKRALGDLGSGYTGSEDQLQEIKVLQAYKPCPKYEGESKLGIHLRSKQWVLVASDKTITTDGEIEDLIFWSDSPTRIKYQSGDIKTATPEDIGAVAGALTDFNAQGVCACVVGWIMAVPFKARLPKAVPQLRRQFPLLLLWGERGAGKTKTVEAIVLPFFSDHEGARKCDEMTRFTFMLNAHSTNLIPLAFDEYKPSKLNAKQVQDVSSFCRSSYDALTGERGQSGPDGLGSRTFTYTAPVVIMGEQSLIEPALKERIIEVIFTKEGRRGARHIQDFMMLNLAGVGQAFIKWSLGVSDDEIAQVWRSEFAAADKVFEDRVRQNIATIRMGWRMWEKFLAGFSTRTGVKDIEKMLAAIDASQKGALIGDGPRAKSDVDLIIEGFGAMAAMGKDFLKEGEDWKVGEEGRKLMLRLQTVYPKFKKWAREFGFDGEVLDEASFKRRLKSESYFAGRTTMQIIEEKIYQKSVVKVYSLDVGKCDAAGLDLSGFRVDEVPF